LVVARGGMDKVTRMPEGRSARIQGTREPREPGEHEPGALPDGW